MARILASHHIEKVLETPTLIEVLDEIQLNFV